MILSKNKKSFKLFSQVALEYFFEQKADLAPVILSEFSLLLREVHLLTAESQLTQEGAVQVPM